MSLFNKIMGFAQKNPNVEQTQSKPVTTKNNTTAQTDFGSTTVQLNKSSEKTYSVDKKNLDDFDKKTEEERNIYDLIGSYYKTEDGKSMEENSAEMNSAAWALYDNNSDNKEFKDAVTLSYKKAQVYAQLGEKLDNDDMIKQVDDFFKNGAKVEDLKDGDLKDALKDYKFSESLDDVKTEDIPAEVILTANLPTSIKASNLTFPDISTQKMGINSEIEQALSDAVDFETKQEINLDDYTYETDEEKATAREELEKDIREIYNLGESDAGIYNAIRDIKAHNESLKDVGINQVMDELIDMAKDGKADNDMITTSSNSINAKIDDFDKMDDEEKKTAVRDEIAKQYGLENSESLTTSAAGQNILNNIMLDHNNDAIFNGKSFKDSDELLQCIADSVENSELKLATPDTKVSFIGDKEEIENLDAAGLKEKALEEGDYQISYLSVTQEKVSGEELAEKAGKNVSDSGTIEDLKTVDLLNYVQYEDEIKENGDLLEPLTLKDKYDEYFNEDGSIKDGVDANEAASIKALCESSVQQLLDTNQQLNEKQIDRSSEDILNADLNIDKNDKIELQPISYMTQNEAEEIEEPQTPKYTPPTPNNIHERGTITETITDTPEPEIVTSTITDKITDTVTDTVTDKVTDTVTDKITDTVTDTVTDRVTDTVTDKITDTVTNTITNTVTVTNTVTITDPGEECTDLPEVDPSNPSIDDGDDTNKKPENNEEEPVDPPKTSENGPQAGDSKGDFEDESDDTVDEKTENKETDIEETEDKETEETSKGDETENNGDCDEKADVNPSKDDMEGKSPSKTAPDEAEAAAAAKNAKGAEENKADNQKGTDEKTVEESENNANTGSQSDSQDNNEQQQKQAEAEKQAQAKAEAEKQAQAAEEAAAAKAAQEAAAAKAAQEAAAKKAAEEAAAKKAAEEAAAAKAAQEAAAAKAAQEAAAAKAAQEAAAAKAAQEAAAAKAAQEAAAKKAAEEAAAKKAAQEAAESSEE